MEIPHLIKTDTFDSPVARMKYRVNSRLSTESEKSIYTQICSMKYLDAIRVASMGWGLLSAENTKVLEQGTAMCCAHTLTRRSKYAPVTFMSEEAYNKFSEEGSYMGFWELVKSGELDEKLHPHLCDDIQKPPELSRGMKDMNSYGELGIQTAYAYYLDVYDEFAIAELSKTYGSHAVVWSKELLKYCTVSFGDYYTTDYIYQAKDSILDKVIFLSNLIPMLGQSLDYEYYNYMLYILAGEDGEKCNPECKPYQTAQIQIHGLPALSMVESVSIP